METHPKIGIAEIAAARILGVSSHALRNWRRRRVGPRYFKAGRLCRYRRDWLEEWMEAQTIRETRIDGAGVARLNPASRASQKVDGID